MDVIELCAIIVWLIFGAIGWIRGFFRELGITIVLLGALILLWFLEPRLSPYLERFFSSAYALVSVLVYSGIMIVATLIAYEGQTIAFPGKDPGGPWGTLWSVGMGLFNGYLVVGTIWYYLNKYGYPHGTFEPPLTGLAQSIIRLLPFNFIPTQYLLYVLIGGLLFLLLLRVIR